jgi:hypothetical protein
MATNESAMCALPTTASDRHVVLVKKILRTISRLNLARWSDHCCFEKQRVALFQHIAVELFQRQRKFSVVRIQFAVIVGHLHNQYFEQHQTTTTTTTTTYEVTSATRNLSVLRWLPNNWQIVPKVRETRDKAALNTITAIVRRVFRFRLDLSTSIKTFVVVMHRVVVFTVHCNVTLLPGNGAPV